MQTMALTPCRLHTVEYNSSAAVVSQCKLYSHTESCAPRRNGLHAPRRFAGFGGQNFKASSLGLNTAANMPGGAANTFPIFNGLTVDNTSVRNWESTTLPLSTITGTKLDPRSGSTAVIPSIGGDLRHQLFGRNTTFRPDLTASVAINVSASAAGQNLYGAVLGDGFASFVLGQRLAPHRER